MYFIPHFSVFFCSPNEILCSLHDSVSGMYHTSNVPALLTVISRFSYNQSAVSPGNSVTCQVWDCHSVTRFTWVLCVITKIPVVCPVAPSKLGQSISLIFGGRLRLLGALLGLELLCIMKGQVCAGEFSVCEPYIWALQIKDFPLRWPTKNWFGPFHSVH